MSKRIEKFEHDGLTFHVRDAGPMDGEPIVLLHGFPERNTSWRHVAPLLNAQGYRTFALDQRGYSRGARPPHRWDYRISKVTGDAVALIDLIGGPVHVVGHDWGAVVAWSLAKDRPELVRSLTAVSVPFTGAFRRALFTSDQALRSTYVGLFQLPKLPELAASRPGMFDRGLRSAGMTREEVERFREEMVEDGALPGGLAWYRALPFAAPSLGAGRITVPTTFVWSDGDTAIARRGAEATKRYVDAPYRFEVLEGVTHWIPTQAPERLAELVLDRVASVAGSATIERDA